jgi:hypothetical protein
VTRVATPLAVAGSLGLALVVAAACADRPLGDCLEPNAEIYSFYLPGSSSKFFHWPRGRMPLRVYVENPALNATVEAGALLWMRAMYCSELSLVRTGDSAQADIVVRNPGALPAPRPGTVVAAADSIGACSGSTQFDTNADTTQLIPPMRVYLVANSFETDSAAIAGCYRFTFAHELGHALGLFRHSSNPDDIMFSTPYRSLLTLNDRYTIQKLYNTTPTVSVAP